MNPVVAREREVLDVLAATGGVRILEPNTTGIGTKSFTGLATGLTIGEADVERYFLVKTPPRWFRLGRFSKDPCLAVAEDVGTALEPSRTPWRGWFGEALAATGCGYFIDEHTLDPTLHENEWGWTTPVHIPIKPGLAFAPAGEVLDIEREYTAAPSTETPDATESLDLVEAVRQIRETTKLPVQDLSAMLGIKRRALYNWLDGTSEPPSDRIRRLFGLRDTVSRLDAAALGDTRRVRMALLAPITGDSVFEAFADDDSERMRAAVDAAERALAEGARLVRRVPPSARTKSSPGAAEELRLERDSLGLYPDRPDEEDVIGSDVDEELLAPLTAREREILQLLADGRSNVDVAEKLLISQETVKSHVRHILAKLEADASTSDRADELGEAPASKTLDSDDRS